MLVRRSCVFVSLLAMLMCCFGVFLGLFVLADCVMMLGLMVMMRCGVVVRCC